MFAIAAASRTSYLSPPIIGKYLRKQLLLLLITSHTCPLWAYVKKAEDMCKFLRSENGNEYFELATYES